MDIGTEEPAYTIEPLENPVPGKKLPAPQEPAQSPVEVPEKEKVPA